MKGGGGRNILWMGDISSKKWLNVCYFSNFDETTGLLKLVKCPFPEEPNLLRD